MKITKKIAKYYLKKYNINQQIVPLKWFSYAMEVELEHGSRYGNVTNVTHDDLDITVRIVLAHLIEDPFYYQRLYKMEQMGEKYWKNKKKPNIFNI